MGNENFYKKMLNDSPAGYAYHKINFDQTGIPYDYEFLEVNVAFEKMIGLDRKSILGKKISEIFPLIKEDEFDWLKFYGEIALSGEEKEFVQFSNTLKKWYKVKAFSTDKSYFITWLMDISEEKNAVDGLLKAKEDNLSIIEGANIGTFLWNVQTGEQIINERWAEIVGYTAEELSPVSIKTWENLCHPEDFKRLNEVMDKSFQGNEDRYEFEFRMKHKDGRWIWVQSHSKVTSWTSEGDPLLVSGIHESITTEKELEIELEENEQRYRWIFEQAPVGIVNIALNGRYLKVNQTFCEMIGYSEDELLALDFMDITLPEDQQVSLRGAAEMLDGTLPKLNIEKRYQKKDGTIVWVDVASTLTRNQEGQPLYFNVFIKNITERIEFEKELSDSEDRFKAIFNQAPLGIALLDSLDGKIYQLNETYTKITGRTKEEMMAIDWMSITHPDDLGEDLYNMKLLNTGEQTTFNRQKRYIRGDGAIVWVNVISVPINLKNREQKLHVSMVQDITEQVQTREILKKTMSEQKLLLDNLEAGVVIHAADTSIISYNPIAEKLLGLKLEEKKDKKATNLYWEFVDESGKLLAIDDYPVVKIVETKKKMESTILGHNISESSGRKWFLVNGYPLFNENKQIEKVVTNFIDITESRKAQEDLNYLIYHNHLTGLYNRRFYEEELKRIDVERNLPIALIMADINGLKLANDAFGHKVGDLLLMKAAEMLKNECRSDEIIARIGGDEFVILLPKTSKEESIKLIERIKTSFESQVVEGLPLSISLGYAVKKIKEEDMNEIFKNAEDDMYRHKLSETSSMRSQTIKMIMNSLYEKNNREMLHSNRVGELCAIIATHMYFSKDDVAQMRLVGQMHDIGKIGISNEILNKTGKLDEEEWNEIKKHSEIGYRILNSSNEFSEISVFVLEHQERWDGTGYPRGLKGTEISIEARIIGIADAYDAMTSDRTYRKGMEHKQAVEELKRCAGTQFDPDVVMVFLEKVLEE